jgi:hypothetical protein
MRSVEDLGFYIIMQMTKYTVRTSQQKNSTTLMSKSEVNFVQHLWTLIKVSAVAIK